MTSDETLEFAEPLDDATVDRLEALLDKIGGETAMNAEMLDGFLCALVIGPDVVMPSEYLPHVFGATSEDDEPSYEDADEARELFSLIMRHWNHIAETLYAGKAYLPVIYQDETGASHGNDWASGFVEGMSLRNAGWKPLLDDDDHAGSLIPIFALAHEHDPDPRVRPYAEPMSAEQRENLISGCIAGLVQIHRYFLARRSRAAGHAPARRSGAKVGRNDPCPCGSGKKYKHCCGASPLH